MLLYVHLQFHSSKSGRSSSESVSQLSICIQMSDVYAVTASGYRSHRLGYSGMISSPSGREFCEPRLTTMALGRMARMDGDLFSLLLSLHPAGRRSEAHSLNMEQPEV